MSKKFDRDEIDCLNMLADRSLELRNFVQRRLEQGCTLHSAFTHLQDETDRLRGWLIGRFGG